MLSSTDSILTSYNSSLFFRLTQILVFRVSSVLLQSPMLLLVLAQSFEQGRSSLVISVAA